MRSVIFLKRNRGDGEVFVRGDFSKIGVLSLEDTDHEIPLDADKTLWVTEPLSTLDRNGQNAMAKLLRENPDVGDFLLKLITAAAREMNEAAK